MNLWKLSLCVLLVAAIVLIPDQAQARLPRPIKASGTVLAVNLDSKTLVFKPEAGRKPLLLDWNKQTGFRREDRLLSPDQVAPETPATIYYKDLTFRHPLLKKLVLR